MTVVVALGFALFDVVVMDVVAAWLAGWLSGCLAACLVACRLCQCTLHVSK